LRIEKLEHRVARLLRVQSGRSSEKMDIAQLRLMFEEVEAPEPANDEVPAALVAKSARKPGSRVPLPAHFPRQTVDHQPSPCSGGCNGPSVQIDEAVTEVLDYVPARFRVIRHVRPRLVCRSCEQIRQAPAVDLPLPRGWRAAPCWPTSSSTLCRSPALASAVGNLPPRWASH
jgi:hypothetical protein